MNIDKSPGQVAYEAFSPLGKWEFVDQDIRAAWEAAAQAVLNRDRSTLDAVVRELESCRNMLVDIWDNYPTRCETCLQSVARVDERIEQSFMDRVEAADAAIAKAKPREAN